MKSKQVSLSSALLFLAAAQFWIVLILIVGQSIGFGGTSRPSRWTLAIAILMVATAAIHRLLPRFQKRLVLAALLAGAILVGAIGTAAAFAFFAGSA